MRQPRTFVDTNILVYVIAPGDEAKRMQANRIIRDLGSQMVLSAQVLQEFYAVATRKLKLPPQRARDMVIQLSDGEVVPTTTDLIGDAIDLSILSAFSIWDALVIQAAIHSRCVRILSEDLNHTQLVRGVRIENPFK